MKTLTFSLSATFLILAITVKAQSFEKVSNSSNITWFGLDFSNAVMMGNFAGPITVNYSYNSATSMTETNRVEVSPEMLRDQLYTGWNNLILNEPRKYKLGEFFGDKDMNYIMEPVTNINSKVDLEKIKVTGIYSYDVFSTEKIQSIINSYREYIPDGKEGVGVTFIIEKFDKVNKIAVMNVAFFDISSCELLFTDHFESPPGGSGLRNYWAGSIYRVLRLIDEDKWKKWKKNKK